RPLTRSDYERAPVTVHHPVPPGVSCDPGGPGFPAPHRFLREDRASVTHASAYDPRGIRPARAMRPSIRRVYEIVPTSWSSWSQAVGRPLYPVPDSLQPAGRLWKNYCGTTGGPHAGCSNWFVLFIWFIWSVWFNQTNETNQINQITVSFCWRAFSASRCASCASSGPMV